MTSMEQFSLRWNNFHSNLSNGFHELFEGHEMVDVTLAVEGQVLHAHRLILSICSPYFKDLFKGNPCNHPIVLIPNISIDNMRDILEFMYCGEVNILRENLPMFLRTAEFLQVKGLSGEDTGDSSSKRDSKVDTICDNDAETEYCQLPENDYHLNQHHHAHHQHQPRHHHCQQQIQSEIAYQQKSSVIPNPVPAKRQKISPNNAKKIKQEQQQAVNVSGNNNTTTNKFSESSEAAPPQQLVDEESEFIEYGQLAGKYEHPGYEGADFNNKIDGYSDVDSQNVSNELNSSQDNDSSPSAANEAKTCVYCPICYKKFVNRYNLKVHVRDKHTAGTNQDHKCEICKKVMRNKSCLRVHMYHHRKNQENRGISPVPINLKSQQTHL